MRVWPRPLQQNTKHSEGGDMFSELRRTDNCKFVQPPQGEMWLEYLENTAEAAESK